MTNVELLKTMTQRNNLLRQENELLKSQLIEANARQAKTNADLEYVAMMTDVDLEEGDDENVEEI